MRNNNEDELKQVPTNKQGDEPGEFGTTPEPLTGDKFWNRIKWLHEKGLHKGDYQEYEKPYYNLNKGSHYYVLDDPKKSTIKCLSCPIKHGGVLEAHLLTRYTLKEGVLYLDGEAINKTPEDFHLGA